MIGDLGSVHLHAMRLANRMAVGVYDPRALAQRVAQLLLHPLGLLECTIDLGVLGRASAQMGTLPPPDLQGGLLESRELVVPIACEGHSYGAMTLRFPAHSAPPETFAAPVGELAEDLAFSLRAMLHANELEAELAQCRGTALALRNVAEFQQARVALRESEERFRTLVESIEDVVVRVDSSGDLAYVSPSVRRFGYEPAELVGKGFAELIHPDDLSAMIESFARTLEGALSLVECRIRCADGSYKYTRSSTRRIMDGAAIVGLVGVVVDITQQRETEDQLRAAQKMEAVGRLAGGVAHDFNNLLSVIGAFAELALDTLRPHDPLHADLTEILNATRRATALTRQLLAFSRKQNLQPQVLDLNELIAGLEKMLRRMIGEDVELVSLPGANLRCIRADPGQLEQVLMNLVINPRRHAGGREADRQHAQRSPRRCRLRASRSVARHLRLAHGHRHRHGHGRRRAPPLFEPFFTTKEAGKGTGLGLATAYGIVHQSGGAIAVRSSPGEGATFQIWLPVADESDGERNGPETSLRGRSSPRGHGTILLVEDEEAVRNLVRRVLAATGYTVLTAANGGEALLICEAHQGEIDLMLTDVVMPGISGPALARRLAPLQPAMRVVFMSGYARDEELDLADAPLLDKPFTVDALVSRVRSMLEPTSSTRA